MKLHLAVALLLLAASLASAVPPPQSDAVPGPDKSPDAAMAPFAKNIERLALTIQRGPARDGTQNLLLLSVAPLKRMAPPKGHTWLQIDKPQGRNLLHYLKQTDFFRQGREADNPPPVTKGYRILIQAGEDRFGTTPTPRR
jgi:hypothetical protein